MMGHKNTILLVLVATTLMAKEALAAQHVVGGAQGWDQSTDFNSWISGQTFHVGDQLVFKYSSLHSVVELGSESAYKNCDIGSPVKTMSSGNDVVKLDKPGTRYFTCGTLGHCSQGMKVKITIGSNRNGASSPESTPSSSSSSSSPAATSAALTSQGFASFALVIIVAFSVSTMLSLF
ncbi:hypothetical protein PIB30_027550 [Stylosanthes scabra]|uniref:Phytocyanin domain-containing protein n=1 Tax=Stylosanthes scabra TaxID=79078 RepID=A0ABU6UB43_9FABA|nr:hypothetical protein [Stylosanthes scabra]